MPKVMAANLYQAVKQAMQDLVAPQLESLKGEIVALRVEMQASDAGSRAETTRLHSELQGSLDHLRVELQGSIDHLRTEMLAGDARLSAEITQLRSDTNAGFTLLRTEMQTGDTQLRTEMQGAHTALRAEMQALHAQMQGGFAAARAETASVRTEVHALEDKLTVALELRERLVAIEAKLGH